MTSFMSTCTAAQSPLPDSILARSRTWLISRVSRSASLAMMPRNFLRSSAPTSGVSSRISVNARIEVSGVRSSWVTVDTKSSFSRSSSVSRSFAVRSSVVADSSSRDFCSSLWL